MLKKELADIKHTSLGYLCFLFLKGRWIHLSKKIKTSWRFVTKAQPALSKSTAYLNF
jgi:hypothetical protein